MPLSQFEFFMAFYGLLLGLGVAELLGGFANLLRERRIVAFGLITPLLGLLITFEMLANFVDAWNRLQDLRISWHNLLLPTLIGVCYYAVAVLLVPRRAKEWPSLDAYFDARRGWIVGLLLGVNLLIIATTTPWHLLSELGGPRTTQILVFMVAYPVWLIGGYLTLLLSRRRWLDIAAALALIAFYPTTYGLLDQNIFG